MKSYEESRKIRESYIQYRDGRINGLVTSFEGTAAEIRYWRRKEGRIEMTGRRGRNRKQPLYDHKEKGTLEIQ